MYNYDYDDCETYHCGEGDILRLMEAVSLMQGDEEGLERYSEYGCTCFLVMKLREPKVIGLNSVNGVKELGLFWLLFAFIRIGFHKQH